MKSRDVEKLLNGYAALFEYAGSQRDAQLMSEFAKCWSVGPNRTLNMAIKIAASKLTSPPVQACSSGKVDQLEKALQSGVPMLSSAVTAAKLKHVNTLLSFVGDNREMALTDFFGELKQAFNSGTVTQKPVPDPNLAGNYVARLNAAFEDSKAFKAVFEEMKKDRTVKINEAHEIALQFADHQKRGTKAKAFERIWKKHEYYMDSFAAAKAMGGKSAA